MRLAPGGLKKVGKSLAGLIWPFSLFPSFTPVGCCLGTYPSVVGTTYANTIRIPYLNSSLLLRPEVSWWLLIGFGLALRKERSDE